MKYLLRKIIVNYQVSDIDFHANTPKSSNINSCKSNVNQTNLIDINIDQHNKSTWSLKFCESEYTAMILIILLFQMCTFKIQITM